MSVIGVGATALARIGLQGAVGQSLNIIYAWNSALLRQAIALLSSRADFPLSHR